MRTFRRGFKGYLRSEPSLKMNCTSAMKLKIDTQIQNCKSLIETAVEINEELIKLASKSVDPDKLIPAQDMWLHTVTSRNDTVLQKAASYKAGLNVEPEETELDNVAESLSTIVTTQPQDSHEADLEKKTVQKSYF